MGEPKASSESSRPKGESERETDAVKAGPSWTGWKSQTAPSQVSKSAGKDFPSLSREESGEGDLTETRDTATRRSSASSLRRGASWADQEAAEESEDDERRRPRVVGRSGDASDDSGKVHRSRSSREEKQDTEDVSKERRAKGK